MKRVRRLGVRRVVLFLGVTLASLAAVADLTIVSGPVINPGTEVPLGAVLELSTNVPSRVVVTVNDGIEGWEREFPHATDHLLPLLAFKPDRSYEIWIALHDAQGNSLDLPDLSSLQRIRCQTTSHRS